MKTLIIYLFTIAVLVLLNTNVFAEQTPAWIQGYNSSGNRNDAGKKVLTDEDGNIYVSGMSSVGNDNITFLNKYAPGGALVWNRTYSDAFLMNMFIDNQNNIYLTGTKNGDLMLRKYNSAGTLLWNAVHPDMLGYDVFVTSNGGVHVTGYRSQTGIEYCITVKFNSAGTFQWSDTRTLGTFSFGNNIKVDGSGNVYVLGGFGTSQTDIFPYILKYNSSTGAILAMVKITDTNFDYYTGDLGLELDNSGNIYISTGAVFTDNNSVDIFTAKYNPSVQPLWKKRFDGVSGGKDEPRDLFVDKVTGNVYVCGQTYTGNAGKQDIVTIKYFTSGTQHWNKTYNGSANDTDNASAIRVDETGSVYVTGRIKSSGTGFDIATIKYGATGSVNWNAVYSASEKDTPAEMCIDDNGNIYIAGNTKRFLNEDIDMLLVKYSSTVGIQQLSNEIPSEFELSQNYPNPFNPTTNIKLQIPKAGNVKLTVFDVTGREVAILVNENLSAGEYKVDFNATGLTSGVYFYRIESAGFIDVKKMILVK